MERERLREREREARAQMQYEAEQRGAQDGVNSGPLFGEMVRVSFVWEQFIVRMFEALVLIKGLSLEL